MWVSGFIYVQYSHRLSGGEDGVRWCQMLCLSDACNVVSDGVGGILRNLHRTRTLRKPGLEKNPDPDSKRIRTRV